jgi:hypothetical protein
MISIEEYRNHQFTDEEEWNNNFNPKRCSIEALNRIEIKNRGKGPDKKNYETDFHFSSPGPYYDPKFLHLHNWKSYNKILNFTCEQSSNVPHIEFTNSKRGIFCSICHCKNKNQSFKWIRPLYDPIEEEQEIYINRNDYTSGDFIENATIFPIIEVKKEPSKWVDNWRKLIIKIRYSLYNKRILYPISDQKSLYVNVKNLTNYQKLRIKEPNYKDSCIFIKSVLNNFKTDYAFIK